MSFLALVLIFYLFIDFFQLIYFINIIQNVFPPPHSNDSTVDKSSLGKGGKRGDAQILSLTGATTDASDDQDTFNDQLMRFEAGGSSFEPVRVNRSTLRAMPSSEVCVCVVYCVFVCCECVCVCVCVCMCCVMCMCVCVYFLLTNVSCPTY